MRKILLYIVISIVILTGAIFAFFQFYVFRYVAVMQTSMRPPAMGQLCNFEDTIKYLKYGEESATWELNNKFGIYIYAEESDFFELAQNLVNSRGGQWGYVLIPYNMGDQDREKWTRVFDQLSSKKLIPVIQLWNLDYGQYQDELKDAANFLNSFIWPVKYRYIAVLNEPNSADFWYGRVKPEEYAKVLNYAIDVFKLENPDFYMLNAGFNTSAPTDSKHMDAFDYMKAMHREVPGVFNKLDGWASHAYPQPNFSGNPHNTGRWSIRAYDTELAFLKEVLGVNKELPVFITETGWAHAEGENYNSAYLPVEKIGEYFKTAYEEIWLPDSRVRAVMPFTIWYKAPFDHFSWVNDDKVPYSHYNVIKSLKKVKGAPPTLKQNRLLINVCNVQQ